MIANVTITIKPGDELSLPIVRNLVALIESSGRKAILQDNPLIAATDLKRYIISHDDCLRLSDLIIVVGGDGTFLRAARQFAGTGKRILGINRGNLGFLTEFSPTEYARYILPALEEKLPVSERNVMEAVLFRHGQILGRYDFINDAVISKGALSRPIKLDLSLNGTAMSTFSGDGLIISTPTGSTAYSLSAGGPVVEPTAPVYIMTPICPHTLGLRPMILDRNTVLEATVLTPLSNLLLTIDGQEGIRIDENDRLQFKNSDKFIHLVRHPDKSYHEILREKLHWG